MIKTSHPEEEKQHKLRMTRREMQKKKCHNQQQRTTLKHTFSLISFILPSYPHPPSFYSSSYRTVENWPSSLVVNSGTVQNASKSPPTPTLLCPQKGAIGDRGP